MHCSLEPIMRPRNRGGKISKRSREYLPTPAMYVNPLALRSEPNAKESKPKRKKIALSRHFLENLVAGLGFAGGVFTFAILALYLLAGRF